MDSRPAQKHQYEEFEPSTEWVREKESDTLLLILPGFKKDHLRVQLTSARKLVISGQRPLEDGKWIRFQKEFQISENCDSNGITAKFQGDELHIRQPKVITPAENQQENFKKAATTESPTTPKKPADEPQTQSSSQNMTTAAKHDKVSEIANKAGKMVSEIANEAGKMIDAKHDKVSEIANEAGKMIDAKHDKLSEIANEARKMIDAKHDKTSEIANEAGKMTDAKHDKVSEIANEAAKLDGGVGSRETARAGNYKKVVGSLIMGMKEKQGKSFYYLVVAVVMALVLGFYGTNWIRSYGKSKE